jgi:protein FrlC
MGTISLDQITGSNFSYQQMTFERFLDDMVALGRENLELWGIAQHLDVPQFSFADARRMRRQLSARGQSVQCITPEQVMYPVNLASAVDSIRTQSIATMKKAADICVELEAPLLFLTAGRGFEDQPQEDAWNRAVDGLGAVASYAQSLGIDCVIEPLQRHESNLANDSAGLARLLGEVDLPNVFVALDTVAMAVAGETVDSYVDRFGDRIRHVHLVDGKPAGHLVWGDGELPLGEYLDARRRRPPLG